MEDEKNTAMNRLQNVAFRLPGAWRCFMESANTARRFVKELHAVIDTVDNSGVFVY
jgi:hypothetical protein